MSCWIMSATHVASSLSIVFAGLYALLSIGVHPARADLFYNKQPGACGSAYRVIQNSCLMDNVCLDVVQRVWNSQVFHTGRG